MNRENKFISCVIYNYNNGNEILNFMEALFQVIPANFEKYEFIIVDDASVDDSTAKIKIFFDAHTELSMLNVIRMGYYQGIEASMNAGRDLAIGDLVFEFDKIELDYPQNLIMEVYRKALEGYDIVAAAPKKSANLSSKIFYAIYNWGSYSHNKLEHEYFRLVSRRAINRVNQLNTYVPYRKAMYMNCGLNACTIHVDAGKQKRNIFEKAEKNSRNGLAFDSFVFFTNVIEKISLVLSGTFLAITVLTAIYIVYSIFSTDRPVEGWISIMGFMTFAFSGVFLLFTLILKYLSVILNTIFKQKRYVIEDIQKMAR